MIAQNDAEDRRGRRARGAALASYVPAPVLAAARPGEPLPWLSWQQGALLVADLAGFTRIADRIAAHGRLGNEQLTAILNRYYARVLRPVAHYGGQPFRFGGDSLVALFCGAQAEEQAAACAVAVHAALARGAPLPRAAGGARLSVSVGIAAGEIALAICGAVDGRALYLLLGAAVGRAVQAQDAAPAGATLVDLASAGALASLLSRLDEDGFGTLLQAPEPALLVPPLRPTTDAAPLFVHPALVERLAQRASDERAGEHRRVVACFVQVDGAHVCIAREREDWLAEIQRIASVTIAAVEAEGGLVLGADPTARGFKLLAVFGLHRSGEDDVARAGLAMLAVGRDLRAIPDPLRWRIGMNAGIVFAGDLGTRWRRDYTVLGDAVNVAARLAASAEPGQVVAHAALEAELRSAVRLQGLTAMAAKGKDAPLPRVLLLERRARPLPALRPPVEGVHGREREQQRLAEIAETVRREGRFHAALLVGPAGIGKSALLATAARAWSEGGGRVIALALPEAGVVRQPYVAWLPALRLALGLRAGATVTRSAVRAALGDEAGTDDVEILTRVLDRTAEVHLPETEPATVRQRIRAGAIALLTRAAKRQPLALIADDAGRLDDASLDILTTLVEAQPAAPLLLLAAARDAERLTPAFDLTLALEGLDDAALERAVCTAIGAARLDARVLAYLREKTGGNPLFAVTLARAALAAEAIAILPGAGNCVPIADLAAVSAPDSLAAALLAGVDVLPEGERRLAQIAAVCGERCDLAVLHAVAAPLVPGAFDRLLASLEMRGVVARVDARGVAFARPLLRDALYEALPSAQRRSLHRRIAEAALALPGIEEEFIAYHLSAAGDPRVVPYALRLGDRARDLADGAAALRAYRAVIAGPERVRRADPAATCRALTAAGDTLVHLQPRYAEALRYYQRALRLADSAERAAIAYRIGYVCRRLGRNTAADRWLRRAARAGAGTTRIEALLERASLAYLQNVPARALRLCAEALRIARATGSLTAEARVLDNRGTTLSGIGRLREAVADLERSVELSARLGNAAAEAKAVVNLGAAYFRLARWEEAARAYERARALRRQLGDSDRAAQASLNLGEVLGMRGEIAAALSLFAECRAVWERSGYAIGVAHARFFTGQALARSGRPAAAAEELEAAMRAFQVLHLRGLAIHAGALLAETLCDAGARRRARRAAHEVTLLESGGSDLHRAYALRALAVAGNLPSAAAEEKLRQAADLFAALGLRWECAWTRLRLAETLAPIRPEEATELAALARAAFAELETPPEEARAALLLERLATARTGA